MSCVWSQTGRQAATLGWGTQGAAGGTDFLMPPGSSRSGRGHDAVRGVEGGESAVTAERRPPAAPPAAPGLLRQPGFPPGTAEPSPAWPGCLCAGTAQRGTRPGHSWERDGLHRPPVPAVRLSLLSACPCQLAASSRAALTSAASRAVSWEKSVHGASLLWQCNLLRASKSCISSPMATGSGSGVAGTGNGDVQWDVLALRALPWSVCRGVWPW